MSVTPASSVPIDPNDAEANKGMAVLAYLLFFVPLLTGAHKTSPFVKFHTNQGTVNAICCVAYSIIYSILGVVFSAILFTGLAGIGIYSILMMILSLVFLVFTAFAILGIVQAVTGKASPLPLIGKFKILK